MRLIALFCIAFLALPARAEIMVFAAASLRGALDEVNEAFGEEVLTSYASSAALARQISQGAPAEVFISANPDWVRFLESDEYVDLHEAKPVLGNQLVLISGDTSLDTTLAQLPVLLEGRDLAMGLTEAVPAGIYAREALVALGFWEALAPHIVQTDNVRAALTLASLGEVNYAIVYQTDAQAAEGVRVLDRVDPALHAPIQYVAATLDDTQEIRDYFAFLSSKDAQSIFADHGFLIPEAAND